MSIYQRFQEHLSGLFDLVAPFACLDCREPCASESPLCPRCLGITEPAVDAPAWVSVARAFAGPIERAVHKAKYGGDPTVARRLGELMVPFASVHHKSSELVVPVPLSRWRLCARGFNQSVELSRAVARVSLSELCYDALVRVRETPSQTRYGRSGREENVRGAFAADTQKVQGARVLLIDDVVTTGATLSEARNTLLAAGARSVHCAAVAHATLLLPRDE